VMQIVIVGQDMQNVKLEVISMGWSEEHVTFLCADINSLFVIMKRVGNRQRVNSRWESTRFPAQALI
jgi:hypothetical protein